MKILVLTSNPLLSALASRVGQSVGTPDPVAVEDPWDVMNHLFRGESRAT